MPAKIRMKGFYPKAAGLRGPSKAGATAKACVGTRQLAVTTGVLALLLNGLSTQLAADLSRGPHHQGTCGHVPGHD
jgi:hypothetical protein